VRGLRSCGCGPAGLTSFACGLQLNEQWLRGLELKPDIRSLFHRDCELEYMAPSSTAKMLLASTKRPLREQFLGL
jgi:hypothetical protein